MTDFNKYIIDGEVKRDRIVADIKRGRITENEILELDKKQQIKEAYFGPHNFERLDSLKWDNNYLDELALAAVSEVFNKEYLVFLCEVASFVKEKQEQKSKISKGIIIAVFVFILLAFAILFLKSKSQIESGGISFSSVTLA